MPGSDESKIPAEDARLAKQNSESLALQACDVNALTAKRRVNCSVKKQD